MSQPILNIDLKRWKESFKTIVFMIVLSFVCALILSILASVLEKPKEVAKDLDRSKQMMIAAKILDHNGHFLLPNSSGEYVPARYDKNGSLSIGSSPYAPSQDQLIEIYKSRLIPMLIDEKGNSITFQKAHLNEENYLNDYRKTGYYKQPLKLIYKILPNHIAGQKQDMETEGYVIPINGFGLWDAIYGYIAIKTDGNTVIGVTWYDQKETPGLGANISEASWQNLFPGKLLFQQSSSGQTDFKTAPLGIIVVKGKVTDVFGNSAKSKSAVDGMAGATLTGNGVTDAFRDVLAGYRPFLMKLQSEQGKKES